MNSVLLFLLALLLVTLLGPFVLLVQLLRKTYRKESISIYLHTVAVSLDQLGGSLLYGEEDWTISSIAFYQYKYKDRNKWFMCLINFLFQDKMHCENSFETEYRELGKFPR